MNVTVETLLQLIGELFVENRALQAELARVRKELQTAQEVVTK